MLRGLYLANIMFRYVSFTSQALSFIALNQASFISNFTLFDLFLKSYRIIRVRVGERLLCLPLGAMKAGGVSKTWGLFFVVSGLQS